MVRSTKQTRENWLRHVQQVMRSRHYSWLLEARDGEPINRVLVDAAADIMHMCQRAGVPVEQLIEAGRRQYEAEEAEAMEAVAAS